MDDDEIDEEAHRLNREWGDFLTKKDLFKEANIYYTKCLEIDNKDAQALYARSLCLCDFARTADAVQDAKEALKLAPHRLSINLQVSKALFDSNDFEQSKIELHNNSRKFDKINLKKFEERLEILNENYLHSLGDQYVYFAQNNNLVKIFDTQKYKNLKESDKALWKILKEQDKCDVVSILEKEEELLHPREIERRKLCYKNFTQVFLHKGSKDIQFLANLRNNHILLLPQTTNSTKKLTELVNTNYDVAFKFLKMLQARNPVYTQKYKTGQNQLFATREKENHILRLQYQTRRDMFNILKRLRKLRDQRKLEELSKLVDYTIREYVILKTNKVMTRKFEFINEVCNILALAYVDRLKIPDDLFTIYDSFGKIKLLLDASSAKEKEYSAFVFGDKSTFTDPEAKDPNAIRYNNRLHVLEKRLLFATFPIEKCYFYHEIALSHLNQSKNDMCITVANKTIAEAIACKNIVWQILGYQLICKTLIAQQKLERLREVLVTIIKLLKKSKITRILQVFQATYKYTEQALLEKKMKRASVCISTQNSINEPKHMEQPQVSLRSSSQNTVRSSAVSTRSSA